MVTGGSYNLSPATSIQVISKAPESPGEQGVTKSSTMLVLSSGEGPLMVYNKRVRWIRWSFANTTFIKTRKQSQQN